MKLIKYILLFLIMVISINCHKSKNDINPLIIGDWRLYQIYEVSWKPLPGIPIQTISFKEGGKYSITYYNEVSCNGDFIFIKRNSLKMIPNGCLPIIESNETIYTLTSDTLTISNKSDPISSYTERIDKYIKIK